MFLALLSAITRFDSSLRKTCTVEANGRKGCELCSAGLPTTYFILALVGSIDIAATSHFRVLDATIYAEICSHPAAGTVIRPEDLSKILGQDRVAGITRWQQRYHLQQAR